MDIKGDRRGLRCLAHGFQDDESLLEDLDRTLARQHAFLGTAQLTVDVDTRPLTAPLLTGIADVFAKFPPLRLVGIHQKSQDRSTSSAMAGEPLGALVVRSTLRSGQVIEHSGDIVILGDANPGARIIAGGDIFVLGRLSGMAMAGQPDGAQAQVSALIFEPSQVRIGRVWAVPAGDSSERPETAQLEGDQIVVSPWQGMPESLPQTPRGKVRRLKKTAKLVASP